MSQVIHTSTIESAVASLLSLVTASVNDVRVGSVFGDSGGGAPWRFGEPLMGWWDPAFLAADTGFYDYVNNKRNAEFSTATPVVDVPNFPQASAAFPNRRYFNFVAMELASVAIEADAPPRPGREPGLVASGPDLIPSVPGPTQTAKECAAAYINDMVADGTQVFVRIPERELLRAYVEGRKLTGILANPHAAVSWYLGRSDDEMQQIWGRIREYLDHILTAYDDTSGPSPFGVRQNRIAGFLLIDEPESLANHRLPVGRPEVCGIRTLSGNLVQGATVQFEVVATRRAYACEWDFGELADREAMELLGTPLDLDEEKLSFTPTIVLNAASGEYTIRVRAINWWNATSSPTEIAAEWKEYTLTVAEGDPLTVVPAPVITGAYTQTFSSNATSIGFADELLLHPADLTPGAVRVFAGAFDLLDPVTRIPVQFGSAVRLQLCVLNAVASHTWNIPDQQNAPGGETFEADSPQPLFKLPGVAGNATQFQSMDRVSSGSVSVANAGGLASSTFSLVSVWPDEITEQGTSDLQKLRVPETARAFGFSRRCLPPRNWVTQRFLNDLAWVINDVQAFHIAADENAAINGRGTTVKPLLINHNACALGEYFLGQATPGESCGSFFDPPPAQADLRLQPKPGETTDLNEIHTLDEYTYYSPAEIARRQNLAQGDPLRERAFDDPILPFLRLKALQARLNLSSHRFLQPLPTPHELLAQKSTGFWLQAWGVTPEGAPVGADPATNIDPSFASLLKPLLRKGRLQIWMAAALGCEFFGWFSQHYCADEIISEVYNVVAKELYLYHDLRHNRIVRSVQGGISTTPTEIPDDAFVVWTSDEHPDVARLAPRYPTHMPLIVQLLERAEPYESRLLGTLDTPLLVLLAINPSNRPRSFTLRSTRQLDNALAATDPEGVIRLTPHLAGEPVEALSGPVITWARDSSNLLQPLSILLDAYDVRIYHVTFEVPA